MNIFEKYLNQETELYVLNETSEKKGPTYKTKILEIVNKDELNISFPSFRGIAIPFPAMTVVKLKIKENQKKTGVLCVVKSKDKEKNRLFIQTGLYDSNLSQKRLFFRIDCKLKVEFRVVSYNTIDESDYTDFFTAETLNISAGGLAMVTSENLYTGSILDLVIELEKDNEIFVVGRIVRSSKVPNENRYIYGVEVTSIHDRELDILTKFIFKHQRESTLF
jgi:c-di-GMP-binding flagellar brake protein YcgR